MGSSVLDRIGSYVEIKASRFPMIEALLSKSFLYLLNVPGREHMLGLGFHLDSHYYQLRERLVLKDFEHIGRKHKYLRRSTNS